MKPLASKTSAADLKATIQGMLASTSLTGRDLQHKLDSFDFALLESESETERKISSAYICFLIYFVSRFGTGNSQLLKRSLLGFKLDAPFESHSSIIFVSGRMFPAVSKKQVISRTLGNRQANRSKSSAVFNYLLSRLGDKEPIMISVSLDRLIESLSKPFLVNTLPDPRHDCIYIDMKQGSHIELNMLEVVYTESRLFRPNTILMNPLKSRQYKRLLTDEQSSRSFDGSSYSLLKPRDRKLKSSQASHTSIDCSEHSELTDARDSCAVSIVIKQTKDSSLSQVKPNKPQNESLQLNIKRTVVTASPTPILRAKSTNQRTNEGFRVTSAKKLANSPPSRSSTSSPLKLINRKSIQASAIRPSGSRKSESIKLRIIGGHARGLSNSKHCSLDQGQCLQKQISPQPSGPAYHLSAFPKQPERLEDKIQKLRRFKAIDEETRSSKPGFFIVKKKLQ